MKLHLSLGLPTAALALGWALLAAPAEATYTFTKIADTNDSRFGNLTGQIDNFDYIAINRSGTVLFTGQRTGSYRIVLTGDGDTITTIATTNLLPSGTVSPQVFGTAINDQGTVLVMTRRINEEFSVFVGLFTINGETTTPIIDVSQIGELRNPVFNNNGTIGYYGRSGVISLDSSLYASRAGAISRISVEPVVNPAVFLNVNDQDAFVLTGREQLASGRTNLNLYKLESSTLTRLATTDPALSLNPFLNLSYPTINNLGTVAFAGQVGAGVREAWQLLTINSEGSQTVVAEFSLANDKPFRRILGPLSTRPIFALNNQDQVAFVAAPVGQGIALFAGPDPENDKVIAVGDELFDSTITRLEIDTKSLNDAGQIAFIAGLADGRVAVVRAEPAVAPTPEPETPIVEEPPPVPKGRRNCRKGKFGRSHCLPRSHQPTQRIDQ